MNSCSAALYLHFPFCRVKCDYCDFYSVCDLSRQKDYFSVLTRQISELKAAYGIDSFETLYFGGGTPGLADTDLMASLFDHIRRLNGNTLPEELTLECNPVNVSRQSLRDWRGMGITRLSLGVQSFQDEFLKRSGRRSSRKAILSALGAICGEGTFRLNLDLIQGLPGMEKQHQLADLKEALSYRPDHISWYGLILEEGTVLAQEWEARSTGAEDDGESAWEEGCLLLADKGFIRYEISNFCQPGCESLHNSMYWHMKPYLGCGPAAVSMLPAPDGVPVRFRTEADLGSYADGRIRYTEEEILSAGDFLKDFLLMGLRLAEGIDLKRFECIFGRTVSDLFPRSLDRWCSAGLLVKDRHVLRPTAAGMDLLNTVLVSFFEEMDERELPGVLKGPLD